MASQSRSTRIYNLSRCRQKAFIIISLLRQRVQIESRINDKWVLYEICSIWMRAFFPTLVVE